MRVIVDIDNMPTCCGECIFYSTSGLGDCLLYSKGVPSRYFLTGDDLPDWCELKEE